MDDLKAGGVTTRGHMADQEWFVEDRGLDATDSRR